MSNIKKFYKSLGRSTRLVIKCTLALYLTPMFLSVFSLYADFLPFQYELLLISEQLLPTARAFLSTGLIGAVIYHRLEKTE